MFVVVSWPMNAGSDSAHARCLDTSWSYTTRAARLVIGAGWGSSGDGGPVGGQATLVL